MARATLRATPTRMNIECIYRCSPVQLAGERLRGLGSRHHRHDLELHEVRPAGDPALEQAHVVALHQLEAAAEIGGDPTADEVEPLGHHAAALAQAAIDRLGVLVAEALDDHELHQLPHKRLPPPGLASRSRRFASAFLNTKEGGRRPPMHPPPSGEGLRVHACRRGTRRAALPLSIAASSAALKPRAPRFSHWFSLKYG